MTYYFLIPIYNESINLKTLKDNLTSVLPKEKKYFVFVDDCSSDNSIELVQKLFRSDIYKVITKEKNVGPGDSFNVGFNWILENSKIDEDLIITLEGDNTSDLSILPNMINISRIGYELVLASIYAQGGGFYQTSILRRMISFFANIIFRSIFNIKVLTLSSFYRVYHVSLIRKIKHCWPHLISEPGFISMLEILLKAITVRASIIEVPMVLKSSNREGKSKMKIFKTSISYLKFLLFTNKKILRAH